jgi:hypothetical protein
MSKPAKIVSGILVAISIAVIGFFALSRFWFWVAWEVLAAALVAVGCGGEWWLFIHPSSDDNSVAHRRRELQCISIVAIGVAMELLALFHAIPEAMRLEKDVAAANERTILVQSNNVSLSLRIEELRSTNLVLRTELAKLELKLKPSPHYS